MASANSVKKDELLSAEASLPTMNRDTDDQKLARGAYANEVKRIVLNPKKKRYQSKGTVSFFVQVDGEWEEQTLPIRSIDADENQAIVERHQIEAPDIPQVWDDENEGWTMDVTSPQYMEWSKVLNRYLIDMRYDKLLQALDCDIMDIEGERVVWSSVDPSVCDREEALKSLRAMQIPGNELVNITTAIDNLSIKTEVKKTRPSAR